MKKGIVVGVIILAILGFASICFFALRQRPELAPSLQSAQKLFLQERYGEAIKESEKALANQPGWADQSQYLIGRAYQAEGEWKKAEEAYRKVVENYPRSEWVDKALDRLGECYVNAGRWGEGLHVYREILKYYPEGDLADDAQFNMGCVYSNLSNVDNDFNRAIEEYNKVIIGYPGSNRLVETYFGIGECYRNLKDWDKAIQYYQKVIDDYPNTLWAAVARSMKGATYLASNRQREAEVEYQNIVRLPQDQQAVSQVANVQLERIHRAPREFEINADNIKYGKSDNVATYEGSVKVSCKGINIYAEKAVVDLNQRIIKCSGNVRLSSNDTVILSGDQIDYYVDSNRAVIHGNAQLEQKTEEGINKVSAKEIDYFLDTRKCIISME